MIHLCRECHQRTDYLCSVCIRCVRTCCSCKADTKVLHVDSREAVEAIRRFRRSDGQ